MTTPPAEGPPRWVPWLVRLAALAGWLVIALAAAARLTLSGERARALVEGALTEATGAEWAVEFASAQLSLEAAGFAVQDLELRSEGIELVVPSVLVSLGLDAESSPSWIRTELRGGTLRIRELPGDAASEPREPQGRPLGLRVDWEELEVQVGDRELGAVDGALRLEAGAWDAWLRLAAPFAGTQPVLVTASGEGTSFEARAGCEGMDLTELARWLGPLAAPAADLAPQGSAWLVVSASGDPANIALDGAAQVQGASAQLDGPRGLELAQADLTLHGSAELELGTGGEVRLRGPWSLESTGRGQLGGVPVEVEVLGQAPAQQAEEPLLEAWVHVPRVDWSSDLARLAQGFGPFETYDALLAPEGPSSVHGWVSFPTVDSLQGRAWDEVAREVVVHPLGGVSVQYHGAPNERAGGARNLGFPLRVHDAQGTLTVGFVPGADLPARVGLVELTARRGAGPGPDTTFAVGGSIANDPVREEGGEFLLEIVAEELPVDADLRSALDGLSGVESVAGIEAEYAPRDGALGVELTLQLDPAHGALATSLEIAFAGTRGTWAPAAVEVQDLAGRLAVNSRPVSANHNRTLLEVDLSGTSSPLAGPTRIRGVSWTEGHDEDAGRAVAAESEPRLWFQVDLEDLDPLDPRAVDAILAGNDSDPVREAPTPSAQGLAVVGPAPRGRLHAFLRGEGSPTLLSGAAQTSPGGALAVDLEGALPAAPLLCAALGLEGEVSAAAPAWRLLAADRRAGQPLVLARSSAAGGWPLEVELAGLDAGVPGLLERLYGAEAELPRLTGAADLALQITPGEAPTGVRLDLDLDRIRIPGLAEAVGPLRGELTVDLEGQLRAETLELGFADTRGTLEDATLARVPDGLQLSTVVRAEAIPLDQRHLELLLGEETGLALVRDLGASGLLGIPAGLLVVDLPEAGAPRVSLSGDLNLRQGGLDLGVEVQVDTLEASEVLLLNEGGRTRARARVSRLDGAIAGRRLREASFGLTFVEPRLAIEELQGSFEGGTLTSLGLRAPGTAGFFSMDLAPPYGFSLAARMQGVDVGELTRGAFQSEFANEGTLGGNLRLAGELGDPTSIRGTGRVELRKTALWAIPVFQALFAALGFDNTGVFSDMEAWLRLEDGRVEMSGMRLKSALLSLVGEGTLDLEGGLDFGLEVRYSLVDKLGLLNQLIYSLQDELIRVSIGGDMERPVIRARGLLSGLFADPGEGPRLPLPALSPLPRVGR
ncbi:MAG: hypothetical protein ISQ08_02825 [Planctomycetes bacterium]|nr:hypothetical protein [Planctomycetota bacterium]